MASRWFIVHLTSPPPAGTVVDLVLPAGSIEDLFGHANSQPYELTFSWPNADQVLDDTTPPTIEAVRLRQGHLEIDLSETVDLASAQAAISVDQPVTWELAGDGFTLRTEETLAPGTHSLAIGTGLADLGGNNLAQPFQLAARVPEVDQNLGYFKKPDPQGVERSSVGNLYGFQGRPRDPETGFVYFRNRYYDPEIGRFVTTDPLGYADGPSMYGFAGSNPLDFGDPLGLQLTVQVGPVEVHVSQELEDYLMRQVGIRVGALAETWDLLRSSQQISQAGMGNPMFGIVVLQGRRALDVYHQDAAAVKRIQDARERGDEKQVRLEAKATASSFYAQAGQDVSALPIFHTVQAFYQARRASTPFEEGMYQGRGAIRAVKDLGLVLGFAEMAELPEGLRVSEAERLVDNLVPYDPEFAIGQLARGGKARASQLVEVAESQGWIRTQTASGPIKYVDENGIVRLTIKRGSSRAPGSDLPHIEIRNAAGQRVDVLGNPVGRRSPANHTPILWDLQ